MTALAPVEFRFEASNHGYYIPGTDTPWQRRPSVTQLLELAGISDPRWFTEESRQRGTAVHDLTMAYDLEGVQDEQHAYKGYLLAYAAAKRALGPIWGVIEETEMHPQWLFGTRVDRLGDVFGQFTNAELKSGVKTPAHAIQMALQNICIAWRYQRTPESIQRLAIYLKPNGKFSIESFTDKRDFDVAYNVLKEHCR